MGLSIIIKAVAKNPPAVFIVVALSLGIIGSFTNDPFLLNMALLCVFCSVLMQMAYLFIRYSR